MIEMILKLWGEFFLSFKKKPTRSLVKSLPFIARKKELG